MGRIVIELSQPEVVSSYRNDMSTSTQALDQAEVRGKNKMQADADPVEQLLWAVEALKAGGMNKQQVFAIAAKMWMMPSPLQLKAVQARRKIRIGPVMPRQSQPILTLHLGKIRKPMQCLPTRSLVRLARILKLQSTCPKGAGSFTLSTCRCPRHFRSWPKGGILNPSSLGPFIVLFQ